MAFWKNFLGGLWTKHGPDAAPENAPKPRAKAPGGGVNPLDRAGAAAGRPAPKPAPKQPAPATPAAPAARAAPPSPSGSSPSPSRGPFHRTLVTFDLACHPGSRATVAVEGSSFPSDVTGSLDECDAGGTIDFRLAAVHQPDGASLAFLFTAPNGRRVVVQAKDLTARYAAPHDWFQSGSVLTLLLWGGDSIRQLERFATRQRRDGKPFEEIALHCHFQADAPFSQAPVDDSIPPQTSYQGDDDDDVAAAIILAETIANRQPPFQGDGGSSGGAGASGDWDMTRREERARQDLAGMGYAVDPQAPTPVDVALPLADVPQAPFESAAPTPGDDSGRPPHDAAPGPSPVADDPPAPGSDPHDFSPGSAADTWQPSGGAYDR